MKSSKGGAYEREICKLLSSWWTEGVRDDIFWRSAGSGGRATQRSKKGTSTYGQYGDIQAVDPIGSPLVQYFTLELKRGYTKTSIGDVVDRLERPAPTEMEKFFEQAMRSASEAGSVSWLLLTKRNKRDDMLYIPKKAYIELQENGAFEKTPRTLLQLRTKIKTSKKEWVLLEVVGMRLSSFIRGCSPQVIKIVCKRTLKNKNHVAKDSVRKR
jgi:hypothetical protein